MLAHEAANRLCLGVSLSTFLWRLGIRVCGFAVTAVVMPDLFDYTPDCSCMYVTGRKTHVCYIRSHTATGIMNQSQDVLV